MRLAGTVTDHQITGQRPYQEDRIISLPFSRGCLIGILDGHGGADTAQFVCNEIPKLFDPQYENAVYHLKELVQRLNLRTLTRSSGCTISLALVDEVAHLVTVAHLGDSPILVAEGTNIIFQSEAHNARSNLEDREVAISKGARFRDGYIEVPPNPSGLQLTRVLGDTDFDRVLSREPSVDQFSINRRSVVVVASDGFFDPNPSLSLEEMQDSLLRETISGNSAEDVVMLRPLTTYHDNTSLVVWRAKTLKEQFLPFL